MEKDLQASTTFLKSDDDIMGIEDSQWIPAEEVEDFENCRRDAIIQ